MATGASIWLRIATTADSPRPFYMAGLIVAGLWLTLWFAVIFLLKHAEVLLSAPNSMGLLFKLILFLPLVVIVITMQPLTLIALASLWAFPLSSWWWREQQINSTSPPTWGFLEQTLAPIDRSSQQIQIYPALRAGVVGGAIYCGLVLVLRLGIIILVPQSVRDTDWFKLVLYYAGHVGLAALMQVLLAIKASRQVKSFNRVHGLFAAFISGCVMAVGVLVINLAFGGTMTTQFIWETFSLVINWGALLSLLGMTIVRLPTDRAEYF
jgi:hypothetical protein